MGRKKRSEVFDSSEVGIYHCIQRAVRQSWLCGYKPGQAQSYEHRRMWVENRLAELASIFAIDCLAYAIMSNHLHIVVRNRPDILETWSDERVARQYWRLSRSMYHGHRDLEQPTDDQLRPLLEPKRNQELRRRLGDISWFMRYLAEPIARRANKEDGCTGRFWEGRFRCQKLVDETAVLACSAYVDLNPIRAGMNQTPEESRFTSIHARIVSWEQSQSGQLETNEFAPPITDSRELCKEQPPKGDWLAPIRLNESSDQYAGALPSVSGLRASDKGFLAMDDRTYFELVDWTGRQLRMARPSGRIPSSVEPILKRLGLGEAMWCELVTRFGRIFRQAAGGPEALALEAKRRGQRWLQTRQSPLLALAT